VDKTTTEFLFPNFSIGEQLENTTKRSESSVATGDTNKESWKPEIIN